MDTQNESRENNGREEYRVGDKHPPLETRFSSEHQPEVRGKRGPSPLTVIKKILVERIDISNPLTHQMDNLSFEEIIAFQWVAKAFKGDAESIKDILDRCDGKALQRVSQEGAPTQVYAPRVVNYIAVYNNDRPNDATPRELGNTGSGEVPGSTKPEDKI